MDESIRIRVGNDLREFIKSRGMSQRDLADKVGKTPGHISKYLNGGEDISKNVAQKIVEIFPEVRMSYLLTGEGSLTAPAKVGGGGDAESEIARLREDNAWLRGLVTQQQGIIADLARGRGVSNHLHTQETDTP